MARMLLFLCAAMDALNRPGKIGWLLRQRMTAKMASSLRVRYCDVTLLRQTDCFYSLIGNTEPMIYVDADGCPVKDEIYRVAERYQMTVVLVANKRLQLPFGPLFKMVVVSGGFDAADDWIVGNVSKLDVVVTADILLAERCIKKQARVLGHKGIEFTEDNVGMAVANRELMQNLRHMGEMRGGTAPMDKRARSQFLGKLDQILHAIKRLA